MQQVEQKLTRVHQVIARILNPFNQNPLQLYVFKKVQSIKEGGSFGERALIKNETRAASCICSEDCTFATLSRADYNWIIG
jgi:CRP-like cAMP-binding protein